VLGSAAGTESVTASSAVHMTPGSRRAFPRWPLAWTGCFAENLVTEHGDAVLLVATVLRQQFGDGAIRSAFCRNSMMTSFPDKSWISVAGAGVQFCDRLADFDWIQTCSWGEMI